MKDIQESIKQYEDVRIQNYDLTVDEYFADDYERYVADIIRLAKLLLERLSPSRGNQALISLSQFIVTFEDGQQSIDLLNSKIGELHRGGAAIRGEFGLIDDEDIDLSGMQARIAALRESD